MRWWCADDSDDVVGDPVNVAARLETAAAIGDVLIGTETGRMVRDSMPVESVDPICRQGQGEPVAAMRVALSQGLTVSDRDGVRRSRRTTSLVCSTRSRKS